MWEGVKRWLIAGVYLTVTRGFHYCWGRATRAVLSSVLGSRSGREKAAGDHYPYQGLRPMPTATQ